ncbi:MAG TPA: hypothetical protein VI461_06130 [Chitinophagaceae bacterium]|nr:hypothetical protein [Chitinophagaceae bacterium]
MIGFRHYFFTVCLLPGFFCAGNSNQPKIAEDTIPVKEQAHLNNDSSIKAIHVFVALCDNKYQGIVPVSASLGNGRDPKTNLYWGSAYGIKSYFKKSNEWKLVSTQLKPTGNILERLLFKHKTKEVYLLADAYDGQFIKQTTIDFLNASSGKNEIEIETANKKIYFSGASDLLAYIGHDGLMDFSLSQKFESSSNKKRETIILACYSKNYFASHLKPSGATPLLWTSGLMAPEAYTLHDAIHEWINNNPDNQIREAAAKAYSKYQKCSLKAAKNLLVLGW